MEEKNKKSRIEIIVFASLMLLLGLSLIFSSQINIGLKRLCKAVGANITSGELVVRYIPVGQGDAVAINMPNGEVMVIDAGPKTSTNILAHRVKNTVLKDATDRVIDYLILSHPDIDHSGGACALFEEFEVKNFYRPNVGSTEESSFVLTHDTEEYAELIRKSKQKAHNTYIVNKDYAFEVGEVAVKIFAPIREYTDTNQMSCVVKLTYFEHSFLFTGDLQDEAEADMILAHKSELSADVLKVAHHGSYKATSEEFVDCVRPKYAVICVGNNSYGHPTIQVRNRLDKVGAHIMRTDHGDVAFEADKYTLSVMDTDLIASTIFVAWWKIVLALELALGAAIVGLIIKLKREKSKDEV